jgi:hypothetical protein
VQVAETHRRRDEFVDGLLAALATPGASGGCGVTAGDNLPPATSSHLDDDDGHVGDEKSSDDVPLNVVSAIDGDSGGSGSEPDEWDADSSSSGSEHGNDDDGNGGHGSADSSSIASHGVAQSGAGSRSDVSGLGDHRTRRACQPPQPQKSAHQKAAEFRRHKCNVRSLDLLRTGQASAQGK